MSGLIDITGQRFGMLVVLQRAERGQRKAQHSCWECACDCGNTSVAISANLRSGATKSCGCGFPKAMRALRTTHGESAKGRETPEYRTWRYMLTRCTNKRARAYKNYGGRGIKVCERWQKFENFLADMGRRPPKHSIDRFPNNDGDYEPNNCRWATATEQALNTRRSRKNK